MITRRGIGRGADGSASIQMTMHEPAEQPPGRAVLRHRNFALLWAGQTVSLAGNGIFMVALPLEILRLTGNPLGLALVISLRAVSTGIFLLIGGVIVDRFPRRLVMLASDAACGVSVSVMAFLIAAGQARLWQLALIAVILGIATAFFKPAATAIVPDILPGELLHRASSLSSLSESLALFLLGPLAGGVISAVAGTGWAFAIDGASFAVSAACLAAMRGTPRTKPVGPGLLAGVTDGLRFCYSQRWLGCSMAALGIANLACFAPFYVLEALLARNIFHAGPVALGVLYAASGGGGAAAALAAGRLRTPRRRVLAIWMSWAAAGTCAALVGLAPWLWLSVVFAGLTWGLATYGNIAWFPLLQQETPSDLLGRVSSVDWLFSFAVTPLGVTAAGAAVAAFGVRATLVAGGVIAAATGSVLLVPGVTDPDKRAVRDRWPPRPAVSGAGETGP